MTSAIVLASNNANKRREILAILEATTAAVLPPEALVDEFGAPPDPIEDGDTYLENARIKARAFSRWSGLPTLADDSGLEIAALGGQPGLYSARYAGPTATYADNNHKLLRELAATGDRERRARFVCVLALSTADADLLDIEGVCEGTIAIEPRGRTGFGYDPIFIPDGQSMTFAEMGAAGKATLSHRGCALARLRHLVDDGRFPVDLPMRAPGE